MRFCAFLPIWSIFDLRRTSFYEAFKHYFELTEIRETPRKKCTPRLVFSPKTICLIRRPGRNAEWLEENS